MTMINRPAPLTGSEEDLARNYATHVFMDDRCAMCDCRPWGTVAQYPCGVEPPREDVDTAAADYAPASALEALLVTRS